MNEQQNEGMNVKLAGSSFGFVFKNEPMAEEKTEDGVIPTSSASASRFDIK